MEPKDLEESSTTDTGTSGRKGRGRPRNGNPISRSSSSLGIPDAVPVTAPSRAMFVPDHRRLDAYDDFDFGGAHVMHQQSARFSLALTDGVAYDSVTAVAPYWETKYYELRVLAERNKNFRPRVNFLGDNTKVRQHIEDVATVIAGTSVLLSLEQIGTWHAGLNAVTTNISAVRDRLVAIRDAACKIAVPQQFVDLVWDECKPRIDHVEGSIWYTLPQTTRVVIADADFAGSLLTTSVLENIVTDYQTALQGLINDDDESTISRMFTLLYPDVVPPTPGITVDPQGIWRMMANTGLVMVDTALATDSVAVPVFQEDHPLHIVYQGTPHWKDFTLLRRDVAFDTNQAANYTALGAFRTLTASAATGDSGGIYYQKTGGTVGEYTNAASNPGYLQFADNCYLALFRHGRDAVYGGQAIASPVNSQAWLFPGATGSFLLGLRDAVNITLDYFNQWLGLSSTIGGADPKPVSNFGGRQ